MASDLLFSHIAVAWKAPEPVNHLHALAQGVYARPILAPVSSGAGGSIAAIGGEQRGSEGGRLAQRHDGTSDPKGDKHYIL